MLACKLANEHWTFIHYHTKFGGKHMKISPTLTEVKEIAKTGKYDILPVSCEILSDFITPIEL